MRWARLPALFAAGNCQIKKKGPTTQIFILFSDFPSHIPPNVYELFTDTWWSVQWIWRCDNYCFMCFLLPRGMLGKNQTVYILFSKLHLLLVNGESALTQRETLEHWWCFWMIPWFHINWTYQQSAQCVALWPAKTGFGITGRLPGWESWMFRCCYHQADNHHRKDWLGSYSRIQMTLCFLRY